MSFLHKNKHGLIIGLFIFLGAFLIKWHLASLFQFAGHADASAYMIVAKNLYQEKGFTENYIGHWLNQKNTLPHPCCEYWQPLTSMFAYFSFKLFGYSIGAAILPSILLGSLLTSMGYWIGFYLFRSKKKAATTALLVLFLPEMMLPSLRVLSNIHGAVYQTLFLFLTYLIFSKKSSYFYSFAAALGALAALSVLARGDQQLLIPILFIFLFFSPYSRTEKVKFFSLFLGIFILLMLPWYIRNYAVFGGLYAQGPKKVFLMRTPHNLNMYFYHYDFSIQTLIDGGWNTLKVRLLQKPLMFFIWFKRAMSLSLLPFFFVGLRTVWNHKIYWPPFVLLSCYAIFYTLLSPISTPAHSVFGVLFFFILISVEGIFIVVHYFKDKLFSKAETVMFCTITSFILASFFPFYRELPVRARDMNQTRLSMEEIGSWFDERNISNPIVMTNRPWELNLYTDLRTLQIPLDNGVMPPQLAKVTLPYMPKPLYNGNVIREIVDKYKVNYIIFSDRLWWNVELPNSDGAFRKIYQKPNASSGFGTGYTIYKTKHDASSSTYKRAK